MRSLFLSLFVAAVFFPLHATHAQTWQRAEVSFLDWDVSTLISMTPDRLREASAATKFTIREGLPEFVASLDLKRLERGPIAGGGDARLVVDLFTEKGERTTYYASRFRLYALEPDTEKDALQRPIDAAFRERFSTLAHAHAKPASSEAKP